MNTLQGLVWHRLVQLPRPDGMSDPARSMADSVFPALVAAHCRLISGADPGDNPVLAVAWMKRARSEPVEFLLGGRPGVPFEGAEDRTGNSAPLLFPPGAWSVQLRRDPLPVSSTQSWVHCTGYHDPSTSSDGNVSQSASQPFPSVMIDDYAIHVRSPFVWVVLARPVFPDELERHLAEADDHVLTYLSRRSSAIDAVLRQRAERKVQDFARARATGLWSIHAVAGGPDHSAARSVAALMCRSAGLQRSGFQLHPESVARPLFSANSAADHDEHAGRSGVAGRGEGPFLAGTEILSSLVRPPVREVPGVQLVVPYRFDVTPATTADETGPGAALGSVLDESHLPVGAFVVPYETLNRHGFICGATGSGKSQTARRILQSLSSAPVPIPWMVIEPAKAEYGRMAGRLLNSTVLRIRPGDLSASPGSLNPMEPAPGFPLRTHIDLVRALFLAAFQAQDPLPQVLAQALNECYTSAGWNLTTGRLLQPLKPKLYLDEVDRAARERYPSLGDLQSAARGVVERIGYGREVADDIRGFVDVRIGSLRLGTPGAFFEGGHPLDIPELLKRNVVFELEDVANDQDKAFLIGVVLIRIVEHLRAVHADREAGGGLRHVLLVEEAHRLLKNNQRGQSAAAIELFAGLLAEIRAYGEGVLIVEQIPSKILSDVVKNSALKVMHRLPGHDDRDVVGATMNLSQDQSEAVVSFRPGTAAVSIDGEDHPLLVEVGGGMHAEDDDEVDLLAPFTGRRSQNCSVACMVEACTLADMAAAEEVATEPLNVVWSEVIAVQLVTGRHQMPRPSPTLLKSWTLSAREHFCAVATLADRATNARRPLLQRTVDPDDFARRHAQSLALMLAGQEPPSTNRQRYRAGRYRTGDVRSTLSRLEGDTSLELAVDAATLRDWQRRGLTLAATVSGQRTLMGWAELPPAGATALGNVEASGLRAALESDFGGLDQESFNRALRASMDRESASVLLGQMNLFV